MEGLYPTWPVGYRPVSRNERLTDSGLGCRVGDMDGGYSAVGVLGAALSLSNDLRTHSLVVDRVGCSAGVSCVRRSACRHGGGLVWVLNLVRPEERETRGHPAVVDDEGVGVVKLWIPREPGALVPLQVDGRVLLIPGRGDVPPGDGLGPKTGLVVAPGEGLKV